MAQDTTAPLQTDTPPANPPDEIKAEGRRQLKAAQKLQKRLATEFGDACRGIQQEQEKRMQQGGAANQLAKERRKALKDVLKAVSDSSQPLEERLRLLQGRFVAVLQEQLRQDQQILDLQAQLECSRKEVDAGQTELARSQQKVDGLQKLARSLTTDNKGLRDEGDRLRQHTDRVQELLKSIQVRIEDQQQDTHKVLEHNKALLTENGLLKAQLSSTEQLLQELRTTQQDRISALADQLQQQQNDAMSQAAKVHEAMEALIQENQALSLKAALASTFEERNQVLEAAVTDAQAQRVCHDTQMQEMQDSLKKASKVIQSFEKLQKSTSEQQQLTTTLLQERQLLQQQVSLLQQQGRDQADKLRRTQLQKQRLEGLCRMLQARAGGSAAGATGVEVDTAVSTDEQHAWSTDSLEVQGPPAAAGSADLPATCSGTQQDDLTVTAATTLSIGCAGLNAAAGDGVASSAVGDSGASRAAGSQADASEEVEVAGLGHDGLQRPCVTLPQAGQQQVVTAVASGHS